MMLEVSRETREILFEKKYRYFTFCHPCGQFGSHKCFCNGHLFNSKCRCNLIVIWYM